MRRTSQSRLQPATLLLGLLGSLGALPASASMLYDSGPLPYYYSGTSIAYKDSITNSFTLAVDSTVRWVEFPVLAFHGDTPMSVDYLITMDHFGGTVMASGTASLSSYFQFPWPFGNYGGPVLDVEVETFSVLPEIFLNAGTYWLQLQNAGTAQDENLYWIENNGLSDAYLKSGTTILPHELCGPTTNCSYAVQIWDGPPSIPEPGGITLVGGGLLILCGVARSRLS